MNRTFMLALLILTPAIALVSQVPDAEQEIRDVLERQAAAWNKGDIEDFMSYYWNSPELTFQSGNSRSRGHAQLLERYTKTYVEREMGKLRFSDLEVHLLAEDAAYVLGRWKLEGLDKPAEGVFTLVLRKFKHVWRIVHDHTS